MTEALTVLVNVYALFTLLMLVVRFEQGLLLLIPLVPLATYTLRTPITGLNAMNLLIYTAFALALFRRLRHGGPLPPATWPIITFFALSLVYWMTGWLNYRDNLELPYNAWLRFLNLERWVLYSLLYFTYFFGWSPQIPARQGFAWMLGGFSIVATYNVIEALQPSEYLLGSQRVGGLFGQANSNGIFLASYGLLPVVFASTTRSALRRALYWGIFALGVWGVFVSVSRTALLCLIMGLLVYAFYRSRRTFAWMFVLLCLSVPLAPLVLPDYVLERYESTMGGSDYEGVAGRFEGSTANRLVQNVAGLKLFVESPIVGHGLAGFYYRSPRYLPPGAPDVTRAVHSTFLMLITEGGIVWLAGFLWLLASLGMAGKRLHEESADEETRLLGLFFLAAMASKILANFASTEFVTGDVTSYIWISAAFVTLLHLQVGVRAKGLSRAAVPSPWRPRARPEIRPPVTHG